MPEGEGSDATAGAAGEATADAGAGVGGEVTGSALVPSLQLLAPVPEFGDILPCKAGGGSKVGKLWIRMPMIFFNWLSSSFI